jgi:hypothetical protein
VVIPVFLLLFQHGAEIQPINPLVSKEPAWEHELIFTPTIAETISTTT